MALYYPYVILDTNINIELLSYDLYIINSVTGKIHNSFIYKHKTLFKKINTDLYQTEFIELDEKKIGIENIRDCVILFKLYRKDNSNNLKMVLDCYTPNTIETFKSKFHTQNKNIIKTKYKEATLITKKYVNEKSVNTLS